MTHPFIRTASFLLAALCATVAIARPISVPGVPIPTHSLINPTFIAAIKQINSNLAQDAKECAADVAERNSQEGGKDGLFEAVFNVEYKVLLDISMLFSVKSSVNTDCAGPRATGSESALVFDMTTGKQYDPMNLYAIAKKGSNGYEFLPKIRGAVRTALLAKRGKVKGDECVATLKSDKILFLEASNIAFSEKGLYVMYTGPHVDEACYEPVTLSYAELKPYLDVKEAARLNWKE